MNKLNTKLLLILAMGAPLMATPNCSTNTLQAYENLGVNGCLEGNFVLSNFNYLLVNVLSAPVTATDINVTPGLGASGPTLQFSANFNVAGVAAVGEALLLFNIQSLGGPDLSFSSINLTDQGFVSGATSTAAVAEVDCLGGILNLRNTAYSGLVNVACAGGGTAVGATAKLPLGNNVSAQVNIPLATSVQSIDVLKDISLVAVLGSASVTGVGQSFSTATPEPTTFFLAGMTFVVLGVVRGSRVKKSKS